MHGIILDVIYVQVKTRRSLSARKMRRSLSAVLYSGGDRGYTYSNLAIGVLCVVLWCKTGDIRSYIASGVLCVVLWCRLEIYVVALLVVCCTLVETGDIRNYIAI